MSAYRELVLLGRTSSLSATAEVAVPDNKICLGPTTTWPLGDFHLTSRSSAKTKYSIPAIIQSRGTGAEFSQSLPSMGIHLTAKPGSPLKTSPQCGRESPGSERTHRSAPSRRPVLAQALDSSDEECASPSSAARIRSSFASMRSRRVRRSSAGGEDGAAATRCTEWR